MRVVAIVAAGGRGRRLGADLAKQFLDLGGRAILQRSVEALLASSCIDEVVVALPASVIDDPPSYLREAAGRVSLVAGGERRQDSVANAFGAAADRGDVFVVHDAARPFVDEATIDRVVRAAAEAGAAIAAQPAGDTVKRVTAGADGAPVVAETLPRESIYLAQTPQAFRRDVLAAAIDHGRRGGAGTDEAALAEQAGHVVRVVDGDPRNIKITTAADLAFARGLLADAGAVA